MLIEGCDFESVPRGGQLTFARQLVAAFGERLALVGLTTERHRLGRWTERRIGPATHPYFALGMAGASRKPLVPARLAVHGLLWRWRRAILEFPVRNALIIAPEVLLAVRGWGMGQHLLQVLGGGQSPGERPLPRSAAGGPAVRPRPVRSPRRRGYRPRLGRRGGSLRAGGAVARCAGARAHPGLAHLRRHRPVLSGGARGEDGDGAAGDRELRPTQPGEGLGSRAGRLRPAPGAASPRGDPGIRGRRGGPGGAGDTGPGAGPRREREGDRLRRPRRRGRPPPRRPTWPSADRTPRGGRPPSSRRWPVASPSSPPPSAARATSSRTGRTGTSSARAIPRSSRARCAMASPSAAWRRPASRVARRHALDTLGPRLARLWRAPTQPAGGARWRRGRGPADSTVGQPAGWAS